MVEDYKVITITHKSAALKDMGRFVLEDTASCSALEQLNKFKKTFSIDEVYYLPTCNRVLYFFPYSGKLDTEFLHTFNETLYPNWDASKDVFQCYEGEDALVHLFEVSASVDSLVVGEREISRQLKQAYEKCNTDKLTGDNIRLAINATIRTAKRVYAQTRIGQKPVSIVSLAVKKMFQANVNPTDRVLVVGAGQTNRLVAKFLKKSEFENVTVFNRTLSRAEEVAGMLGGDALSLADLSTYEGGFDCMIVCTGAVEPVIHSGNYAQLLQGDTDKKVIIDLSIPNNVAADIVANHDVHYIEIDGLKALASKNMAFRQQEVARAKDIIQEEVEAFHALYKERQLERAFSDMPVQIKEIKQRAMTQVFAKEMENLDDEAIELVERMMSYMEKKCIGIPMKEAKKTFLGITSK